MLSSVPLRWRLTLWYSGALAAILLLVGVGGWFTMRRSVDQALEIDLAYSLRGLREYIERSGASTPDQLRAALEPISGLSSLFRLSDEAGSVVCESQALRRHGGRPQPPMRGDGRVHFRSGWRHRVRLRLASQRISVGGRAYTLEVAEPLAKYGESIDRFTRTMLFALPLALLIAVLGGFWLSSRALQPVDRLTEDARAITGSDLSRRLAVPPTKDELRRLADTLNGMLDRLESAFEQMRRFTADASHELRAPLTLIQTTAEVALRRERSREELAGSMRSILREAQRTSALVNDLLLLARSDSGQETPELAPLDLAPVLHDLAVQTAALAGPKRIQVTSSFGGEPMTVDADELPFRRLLMILADNAVKYTPEGGQIRLEALCTAAEIRICVADNGPGIAPEDLPHIFERFWRADKARTRDCGGSGLGLAIAQEIAARHGARLGASSELGRGTTFTLAVPKSSA